VEFASLIAKMQCKVRKGGLDEDRRTGEITDREVELFSKRHELIDTLSEERG
jgi:hypothetical protein